jgi:hypothetical protein
LEWREWYEEKEKNKRGEEGEGKKVLSCQWVEVTKF